MSLDKDILFAITDMGDSGVLSAIAVVAALYLFGAKCHKAAITLVLAWLVTLAAMCALKIAFIGCGLTLFNMTIHSPSGHAALAAAVYGTLAVIFGGAMKGNARALAYLAAMLLTLAVAASRVLLNLHNVDEVLLGLGVGGIVAIGADAHLRHAGLKPFNAFGLLVALGLTALLLHGQRFPAEKVIEMIAHGLNKTLAICGALTP